MRPLFYQNPVALHPNAHGAAGLVDELDYGFARNTNAIPISLSEIPLAALSYPIAFTIEGGARPVAIVGLRDDENLFVDTDGGWLEGAYVPAYVRRYPFILAEYGEGEDLGVQLCIEDHPEILVHGAGQPLFADGEPSRLVKSAFDFCKSLRAADLATAPFVEALVACGVLDGRAATVKLPTGGDLKLAGFATIDEARLRSLPDEAFL
ncbi:SapC family protein, partial [Phenylobacterium sp.]|uniref:SapC family protein n=1 Tax=Phenylobacterium sp. TaxID=1871053 RepID=UPI00286DC7DB